MKSCEQYIAEAKVALGDQKMSDRELGERLGGYLQQNVARAKTGVMPDTIAIALAKAIGVPPGEVLLVARAEREKNPEVKRFLVEWAKHAVALLPPMTIAPDVVMRDGVKAVRYSAGQGWRKRSPPHTKQRPAPAGLLIPGLVPAGTSRARAPASPNRVQAATAHA